MQSSRLSLIDWTDVALEAMAELGTAGVNVEQLSRRLGTTKGSFYHHFANRHALLVAALARWEEIVAADLAASADIADPRARLLTGSLIGVGTAADGFVDLALAVSVDDPVVAATLVRVNRQRLEWLTTALCDSGLDPSKAQERAVRGLSAYLGLYQLQRTLGETFDRGSLVNQITSIVDNMLR